MEIVEKILKRIKVAPKIEKAQSIEKVAIFGSADAQDDSELYRDAFNVAKALAEAGYIVVDGGGPGVMKAASLGAKARGGKVIGVTLYPKDEAPNFEGRDSNNPIDEEIKTSNYVERTLTMMKVAQVYVVFNGASGTISEFGMAWGLARLYFGHHKPLILYGNFWKDIMKTLKQKLVLRPEESKVYKIVNSPEGVILAIKQFEEEINQGKYEHLEASKENGLRKFNC